jgi:ATP-binding cassette subfamily F protein 3
VLSDANLLLLDEPTNHLDIASREALEGALSEFPGAMVIVSHDRALIDRMVEKLIIIQQGRAEVHLGNYAHYRWKHLQAEEEAKPQKAEDVLKIRREKATREQKKAQVREERKQRRQLEQLEHDIEAMEELLAGYNDKFAAVDPADYVRAQQLKEEYEGLKADLQGLYEEWEAMA